MLVPTPARRLALLLASLPVAACAGLEGGDALAVPTSLAAHEICSAVFISGFESDAAFEATVAPQLGPAAAMLRYETNRAERSVRASLAGLAPRRAVFRDAFGCIVDQGTAPPPLDILTPQPAHLPLAAAEAAGAPAPAIEAALDLAFAENESGPRRRTYAAVVLHGGRLIAERYAPGVGPQTLLHGWSMSKSVTSALVGVLAHQGRLDPLAPAPVDLWARDPNDPRAAITPDHLLRMTSGLAIGQSFAPRWDALVDPANQIMFAQPDMAAAAATRPLAHPPGEAWRYSDGSTALLGATIKEAAGGGDPAATQRFARKELFDRLGMGTVVMETDGAGAPIGATQVYASARDWARLGQLFLDDGLVGGKRLLPEGWVAYATTPTPASGDFQYGAGWWTNRDGRFGLPPGSYMARGARGQYVVVIPSADLVVVKLGDADTPRGDIEQMSRFVRAAVAAVGR